MRFGQSRNISANSGLWHHFVHQAFSFLAIKYRQQNTVAQYGVPLGVRDYATAAEPMDSYEAKLREETLQNDRVLMADIASLRTQFAGLVLAMRDGKAIGSFASENDAEVACLRRYPDGLFSLHYLRPRALDAYAGRQV